MKKAVMIVAQEMFRDEEYAEPKSILENAGIKVLTASKSPGVAKGKLGLTAKVDLTLKEIKPSEFDAMIFVGGPGCLIYFKDAEAHRIAKETIEAGKILGAICAAPGILANAGVLKGKKATAFPDEGNLLKSKGANYTGAGVEVDGKIITADGPESAAQFGRMILKELGQ